jgi:tRNA(Ile)-lysidine synthase
MALALLLAEWAHSRNGRVVALTVNHGLRADSAVEAQQVGRWLNGLPGLTHHILNWTDDKPRTGIQAAARAARYRLLAQHCRQNGILHLCVAHQRDDQVETHRLRAGHQSGSVGLAGMSAIRLLDGVRLLRPLLGVGKVELQALLTARGQAWITDPSNANPAFERVRLRAVASEAGDPRDAAMLHRLGLERQRLESEAAVILADSLTLHETGWGDLPIDALCPSGAAQLMAFGWLLQCLGGTDYPVGEARRAEALTRLEADQTADFTLGGCLLRRRGKKLEIHRDWGAIGHCLDALPGEQALWDDRFAVVLAPTLEPKAPFTIARLGESGLRQLERLGHSPARSGIPGLVPAATRPALPALWQGDRLVAVPHLGFGSGLSARFRPARGAASGGFTVA